MANQKRKIGIFGGTFDPFTDAHAAIVKEVLKQGLVDDVLVVPTAVNYHRQDREAWLTDEERCKLINRRVAEMVTEGFSVYAFNDELTVLKGMSKRLVGLYKTGRRFFHTLCGIIERYGDDYEYYTIVGTDQYRYFKRWFLWEEILMQSSLIVVSGRNGDDINAKADEEDVPFYASITIDDKYAEVSATKIRIEYRGTPDAVNRYLNHLPPMKERVLKHTPIFDLVEKDEVQPGFRPVGINAPDWVTVVIRNRNRYKMVRQIRYGTMECYDEFVCGQVEKGEVPVEAAVREALEETGIDISSKLKYLGSFDTNPAFMNNQMYFYLADVSDFDLAISVPPRPDEHEKLETAWIDCEQVHKITGGPAFRRLAIELVKNFDKKGN